MHHVAVFTPLFFLHLLEELLNALLVPTFRWEAIEVDEQLSTAQSALVPLPYIDMSI